MTAEPLQRNFLFRHRERRAAIQRSRLVVSFLPTDDHAGTGSLRFARDDGGAASTGISFSVIASEGRRSSGPAWLYPSCRRTITLGLDRFASLAMTAEPLQRNFLFRHRERSAVIQRSRLLVAFLQTDDHGGGGSLRCARDDRGAASTQFPLPSSRAKRGDPAVPFGRRLPANGRSRRGWIASLRSR